jgi:molecular chaperone GrpE
MSESKKIKIESEPENSDTEKDNLPSEATSPETAQTDLPCDKPPNGNLDQAKVDYETELDAARLEAQQHYDRLLRVSAEFENYKKRTAKEITEFRKFANESLIKELLPVVDNLERAVQLSSSQSESMESFVEGVEMTLKEIRKIFARQKVMPIESIGQPFDPCFHQAVMQLETSEHPANTVVQELQKGYTIQDRLLRPAMVVVSKSNSAQAEAEPNG